MKLFPVALLLALIASAIAAPFRTNAIKLSPKTRQALQKCRANVCFAISGSSPITPQQFGMQQDFIFNVIASVQKDEFAASAIQYGLRPDIITPLTSDVLTFFNTVSQATFANYPINFLSGGIIGCRRELANDDASGRAKKIVLITDGRSTFGGDLSTAANLFRQEGGSVCAIGIGFDPSIQPNPLNSLADDPARIFSLQDYIKLGEIVDQTVFEICH